MSIIPRNPAHLTLATAFALGFALSALADVDPSNPVGNPEKSPGIRQAAAEAGKSDIGLSGDQQQQALGFARAQHPELADLLEKLREGNPKEYRNALHELYRVEQKLRRMADQNPERHALELNLWKVESRIRLQMAQMALEGDVARDDNLKALLSERRRLKIELLQFDRGKTAERLTNLDRQLEQLQRDPEGDIAKELAKLRQTAGNQARAEKIKRNRPKAARQPAVGERSAKQTGGKPDAGSRSDAGKDE